MMDSEKPSVSRRSAILGASAAAVVLALGAGVKLAEGTDTVLRPPGGQDADRLFARCIRCMRCVEACPEHAIVISKVEDGLAGVRAPKMDFRRGFCDFCNGEYVCRKVCPTDCFTEFDPLKDKIGIAKVSANECLLFHRSAKCSKRCIDVCEYDALELDDQNHLVVHEDLCNGCGACEYVCPAASYQVGNSSVERGINVVAKEGGAR